MDYERLATFIIGLLVNSYWKERDFIRQVAGPGDWAIEITTISNTIRSQSHDFRAQIMRVLEKNDATYRGVRLDGRKQEWKGAMFYKIPPDVQDLLNDLLWDGEKNIMKEI